MTAIQIAIRNLREAVENKGPAASYHDEVEHRHRREWPRLWQRIDELLASTPETPK